MGRPKGAKNKVQKSPYKDLPDDWKSGVMTFSYEEIQEELAKVTKAEHANQQAKSEDPDLAAAKEDVKTASAGYNEATKSNKLRVNYLVEMQEAKGRPVGAS